MAAVNHHDECFQASADALDTLTTASAKHSDPPIQHIHAATPTEDSHKWVRKLFPPEAVDFYESKFHMGNYVIDRRTGQKSFEAMSIYVRVGMHLLYYGSEQERALHWKRTLELLKAQSEKMGTQYDTPASKDHIVPFINSFHLQDSMSEMVKPDPDSYATFNEFFAREIKEEARPIQEPENDLVTSSPADCRLTAFPTVDLATKYWIKGAGFTVEKLLGSAQLAQDFDGGSIVIARLAPQVCLTLRHRGRNALTFWQDYHRWHSPVSGTVEGITDIPGTYYTVNPQAINEPGVLDVFCENKRSVMIIRRSSTGSRIAVIAVGAMLVGSIFYVPGTEQQGAQVRRGQCLGGFKYGGSVSPTLSVPVIYG